MKKKDFVNDLGFDKVYVEGLFYDVERAMQVDLNAQEVESVHLSVSAKFTQYEE